MINETDELLNDMLIRWHLREELASVFDGGYYTVNTTCRLYRTSRQYDDQNGALDADQDSERMQAFDSTIQRIPEPWRTAIYFNAKNLATGFAVWNNPRLPKDSTERAHLVVVARGKLLAAMAKDGLCEKSATGY